MDSKDTGKNPQIVRFLWKVKKIKAFRGNDIIYLYQGKGHLIKHKPDNLSTIIKCILLLFQENNCAQNS